MTPNQAALIVEAHDIYLAKEDEETAMLLENNPELYAAYEALLILARATWS